MSLISFNSWNSTFGLYTLQIFSWCQTIIESQTLWSKADKILYIETQCTTNQFWNKSAQWAISDTKWAIKNVAIFGIKTYLVYKCEKTLCQRRQEKIVKKMDDLKEQLVPYAFCYLSHWTRGVVVCSDPRMISASTMLERLDLQDVSPALHLPQLPGL